jgi:hypothetical protein
MGTVDRDYGAAHPCGRTLAAGAARPWHALTASLSVVVCCFVWLCIRQCHELILKTRAEQSDSLRARAVAGVNRAHAQVAEAANQARSALLAMTGHEIRMSLNPVLGLAATLLIIGLDAQPRMPVEAIPEAGGNLPYLFNDTLDFSKLETGRLALQQRAFAPESAFAPNSAFAPEGAFAPESLVDQTVSLAGVWTDQQAIGLWMADFSSDGKADIVWQSNHNGQAAVWLMNDQFLISASDIVSNPAATAHVQAAGDFGDDRADTPWHDADGLPAAWLMDGFMVSDDDVGFNPATDWHGTQQYYDLV